LKNKKSEHSEAAVRRRDTLKALLGIGFWLPIARSAKSNEEEANSPPKENDVFVFAFGDREGEIITPEDLLTDAPQIFSYPMDPVTSVVRSGTRLNQVLLIRMDPIRFSDDTRSRSAANIVGYSAVCTHTGCDITDWDAETHRFQCPCHDSQFDPADGARVAGGPAPRQLPSLPLKVENGMLIAAGGFQGRVGFQQPGMDPFGY
jgi:Rieske Fe-S protein